MRDAVSRGFTGRSSWVVPGGAWLCRVCAWVYRDERVRRHPMVIRRNAGTARILPGAGARELLRAGLPQDVAVTVPRTGRKHLLPSAEWGRIFFDDVALPWSAGDAARLAVLEELRAAGAGEADLRRSTPPWPLLRDAGGRRAAVMASWTQLDPWRERLPWLEVALVVTRRSR